MKKILLTGIILSGCLPDADPDPFPIDRCEIVIKNNPRLEEEIRYAASIWGDLVPGKLCISHKEGHDILKISRQEMRRLNTTGIEADGMTQRYLDNTVSAYVVDDISTERTYAVVLHEVGHLLGGKHGDYWHPDERPGWYPSDGAIKAVLIGRGYETP